MKYFYKILALIKFEDGIINSLINKLILQIF